MLKVNFITNNHNLTKRKYFERMKNDKISCMTVARKFDLITGMEIENLDMVVINIPGRWTPVAKKIIKYYKLNNNSKILDVGCGKGIPL